MANQGLMSSQGYIKQLDKNIDNMFMEGYDDYPAEYTKVAKIQDAKKGDGGRITEAEITGLGLFQALKEGQGVQFDTPEEGNEVTRRFTKAGLGFQVTEEMLQDELFGKAAQMANTLGKSSQEYVEQIFWDLFNRGFDFHTAKTGEFIFDTDHSLLKPLRGVTTQSNRPAVGSDLSETSLAAGLEYFGTMVDERGMPIPAQTASLLIVHPEDMFAADRLHTQQYGGTYKTGGLSSSVDMSHNAVNPKSGFGKDALGNGGWKPHMGRWLTDNDAWFLLAPDHDFRMVWKKRAALEKTSDFSTGNYLYKSVLRLSTFCNEYRYGYGNPGA